MRKLTKIVRVNIFRILEINQRLPATLVRVFKEKQLNLSKNTVVCGILTCLIPIPLSSSTVALKMDSSLP